MCKKVLQAARASELAFSISHLMAATEAAHDFSQHGDWCWHGDHRHAWFVVALEELGLHGYHYKDARASANEHAREHKLPEFLTEIVEGMLANTSQCLETIENFDFSQLPKNVDYVSDTPFTESFLDVYFQFPEAKVVLTTRPSLEWAKSRRKHGNSPPPVMRPCGLQGLKEYSDEDLASMLEAYHDLVRCVVPRKNLLELNLFEEGLNLTSSLMTFLEDRLPLVQAGRTEMKAKHKPTA